MSQDSLLRLPLTPVMRCMFDAGSETSESPLSPGVYRGHVSSVFFNFSILCECDERETPPVLSFQLSASCYVALLVWMWPKDVVVLYFYSLSLFSSGFAHMTSAIVFVPNMWVTNIQYCAWMQHVYTHNVTVSKIIFAFQWSGTRRVCEAVLKDSCAFSWHQSVFMSRILTLSCYFSAGMIGLKIGLNSSLTW